jgi:hypothetical protein
MLIGFLTADPGEKNMKKIIILASLCISISAFAANSIYKNDGFSASPPDTTLLPQILGLPLASFIGKPVDSLLSVLPPGYSTQGFMPVGIGYTRGICQTYFSGEFNNCFIEIYIDTFQFLPVPNRTQTTNWNINLAKLEKVAFIKVIKNNTICMYGCNNPKYSYP